MTALLVPDLIINLFLMLNYLYLLQSLELLLSAVLKGDT